MHVFGNRDFARLSVELERDFEEDLDDDIRASLHSLPETTTTQGNYNHLNVHIDTTSKGDAPLQKPNKELQTIAS